MGTVTSAAPPALAAGRSLRFARLSDELLARHAGRGSDRAFSALYERYYQTLYRYCRSIVRNDVDAQDVLQSTFTAALSALREDRRHAPLRPWLYRIAHNEAISLLRRRARDSSEELSDALPAQAGSSAEDEAGRRARWATLVADLGGLPERQRGALVMRELGGLSHEEIAIALGSNVGAVKQAIFEARQALTELAEGRAMTCEEIRRRISAGDRRVLRGRRVRAHLRDCRGCEAFAAAIPERRAELRALTPVLPSAAAAAVLSRTLSAVSSHGASGAGAGSAAAGAGVISKVAGTAVASKALAGVAVIATAAAGAAGLSHVFRHTHPNAGVAGSAHPASGSHRIAAAHRSRHAVSARDARTVVGKRRAKPASAGAAPNAVHPAAAAVAAAAAAVARGHRSRAAANSGATASRKSAASTDRGHAGGTSATHSHGAAGAGHAVTRTRAPASVIHVHGQGHRAVSHVNPHHASAVKVLRASVHGSPGK